MTRTFTIGAVAALLAILVLPQGGAAAPAVAATTDKAPAARQLDLTAKPWVGDFDGILERRVIRALVPYSRSLYFSDRGRQTGISAEMIRGFERWLNEKYAKQLGNRPLTLVIIPATRDKLLSGLVDGLADVALGNITVTAERGKSVEFVTPPDQKPVKKIVVTGPGSPEIATTADLAGKTVHVRKTSSANEGLVALGERFAKEGRPAIRIVFVPDALEDEDLLEMVNAGILQAVVVDDWMAAMWKVVLPKIQVNSNAVVRDGDHVGWAIRKGSPKLRAEILAYAADEVTNRAVQERIRKYARRVRQLKNPGGTAEWKRFEQTYKLFERYGKQYGFDPLMLAAQGYQESQLNQEVVSHVGAVGVMQLMPTTGEELRVGDVRVLEPNIHAGAKYMDRLMAKSFPDAKFDDLNRTLFAFASYNAGPGNIQKMRAAAVKKGLDPDLWFNNVELVTAQKIGAETTTYVRNIYKYYVAYKLLEESREATRKAREQVAPAAKGG
jgi:membrane-bound lytic murein transglycosylase MltF